MEGATMQLPIAQGDYQITQYFGENPAAYARFGLAGHSGLDVGLPAGTAVLAPEDAALVESAFDAGGYGNYAKLRTARGSDWLFAHLIEPCPLDIGQAIAAGDQVGTSGSTGNSSGPHLHVGFRPDASYRGGGYLGYVDPLPYLIDALRAV